MKDICILRFIEMYKKGQSPTLIYHPQKSWKRQKMRYRALMIEALSLYSTFFPFSRNQKLRFSFIKEIWCNFIKLVNQVNILIVFKKDSSVISTLKCLRDT